jgi:hypothetical protein
MNELKSSPAPQLGVAAISFERAASVGGTRW